MVNSLMKQDMPEKVYFRKSIFEKFSKDIALLHILIFFAEKQIIDFMKDPKVRFEFFFSSIFFVKLIDIFFLSSI